LVCTLTVGLLMLLTLPQFLVIGTSATALWIFVAVAGGLLFRDAVAMVLGVVLAGLMLLVDVLAGEPPAWELALTLVAVTAFMVGFSGNVRLNRELRAGADPLTAVGGAGRAGRGAGARVLARLMVLMQSGADRHRTLAHFVPEAEAHDWEMVTAGQRVQVIKRDRDRGGVLEFGQEVTPGGQRLCHAEAEEAEAGFGKNVGGHEDAELRDGQRAEVRPRVYERDAGGGNAGGAGLQEPAGLLHLANRGGEDARGPRPSGEAHESER